LEEISLDGKIIKLVLKEIRCWLGLHYSGSGQGKWRDAAKAEVKVRIA
jgi:hypothetical protein